MDCNFNGTRGQNVTIHSTFVLMDFNAFC
uniref:Uncharacterized protein n=1 Tax=Arundo donax TaxID=35708 RepID=A0A0A8ZNP9_ARUDO